jgi:hypothetical protein
VVLFDLPTPRPHFIVKLKLTSRDKCSVKDLNDTEIRSLIELAYNFIEKFKLNEDQKCYLSFHTGDWVSKPKHQEISNGIKELTYYCFYSIKRQQRKVSTLILWLILKNI